MLSGAALDIFNKYQRRRRNNLQVPEESDDVKLSSYKKYDSVSESNGVIPHESESNETKPLLGNGITRGQGDGGNGTTRTQGDGGNTVSVRKDSESPEETGKLVVDFNRHVIKTLPKTDKIIPLNLAVEYCDTKPWPSSNPS